MTRSFWLFVLVWIVTGENWKRWFCTFYIWLPDTWALVPLCWPKKESADGLEKNILTTCKTLFLFYSFSGLKRRNCFELHLQYEANYWSHVTDEMCCHGVFVSKTEMSFSHVFCSAEDSSLDIKFYLVGTLSGLHFLFFFIYFIYFYLQAPPQEILPCE